MIHGDDEWLDPRSSRRSAFERFDRTGAAHPGGQLRVSKVYDWGKPIVKPRYERFDFGRRVWQRVTEGEANAILRLPPKERALLLRTHWRGLRVVEDYDDAEALHAGLERRIDKALASGRLDLGNRAYGVSVSPTGNIRVRSAAGLHSYTRAALLDALQRGYF